MKLLVIILVFEIENILNEEINIEGLFQKNYNQNERFEIYEKNLMKIEKHNARYEKGLESFKLGANKFIDLSEEEFLNNLRRSKNFDKIQKYQKENYISKEYPEFLDWRIRGAVTSVKDTQGCTGADFAFATVGLLEAQYKLNTEKLVNISVQNLIDCVDLTLNNCEGDPIESLNSLTFHGIEIENDYPYEAKKNSKCLYDRSKAILSTTGPNLLEHDEEIITEEIAFSGPLVVQINISPKFQFYSSGTFSDENCNDTTENYPEMFMLAVGYGTENGKDYYILKNSWGAEWGEKGFIRLARNENMCNITNYVVNCRIIPPVDS